MRALLALSAAAMLIAACGSDSPTQNQQTSTSTASKILTFKADMRGSTEVPATPSTATGTFTATLDTSTNVFTYDIVFSGLTSNVTLGHIHGPSTTTQTAGTTLNFATWPGATFAVGATSGTAHGVATLVASTTITTTMNGDSLKKLLLAGLTYANIHTQNYGGGEIRGQIIKQ